MTTTLANLTDTITALSVDFMMNPNWVPEIPEVGALWSPLGAPFRTKSTDGTKGIGGTFTMVAISLDMDHDIETLLTSNHILALTMPGGDVYYIVTDPGTARKGNAQFSLMNFQYINTWTVAYAQVGNPFD